MWLATIEPSRTRPEIRPKLVRYQNEAAEVLARAFTKQGSSAITTLDSQTLAVIEEVSTRVATKVSTPMLAAVGGIHSRVIQVETGLDEVRGEVSSLSLAIEKIARYRRKDVPRVVREQHIDYVENGPPVARCCPWCHASLVDGVGKFFGHIHHHQSVSDASLEATMPLCAACNIRCNAEPMPTYIAEAYHHGRPAMGTAVLDPFS